jgi:protein SCO1/2
VRRAAIVLVLAAFCAGCGGSAKPVFDGIVLTPPVTAPNFALRDQDGRTVALGAEHGHWTVVTFLYTHCPDVCPLIAANLNGALRSDAGRTAGLRVLAVSVDPARATRRAVHTYVITHRLAPSFHFLIGTSAQLEPIWAAYHVAAQPGPHGAVTHSTFEILIDPKGKERLLYDATITTADLVGDLSKLA